MHMAIQQIAIIIKNDVFSHMIARLLSHTLSLQYGLLIAIGIHLSLQNGLMHLKLSCRLIEMFSLKVCSVYSILCLSLGLHLHM